MNNRQIGTLKEQQAAAFLVQKGFLILETNFRCRLGEIDLIAKKDN
ncbi:MAG: YraN family protein, partial [Lachnospiraceae bacterium]|nr:YraN family protein [Lachnospiraceae bacterium]